MDEIVWCPGGKGKGCGRIEGCSSGEQGCTPSQDDSEVGRGGIFLKRWKSLPSTLVLSGLDSINDNKEELQYRPCVSTGWMYPTLLHLSKTKRIAYFDVFNFLHKSFCFS